MTVRVACAALVYSLALCLVDAGVPFKHSHAFFFFRWYTPDPEIAENATEIIRRMGYDTQEHFVETIDGYILCLIRMRNLERMPSRKLYM
ncbi:hypothetical protein D915_011105 [Fasciola hepatica]|uniref:Partial AB-hydrolase lipase domain-containing protein n=1 Tax=Fasciola hepatica TaxID=6192 RepID=A0A4E0RM09_FASHE|nr:hypothetical protein D915_011105 [Fasciola hepatica]